MTPEDYARAYLWMWLDPDPAGTWNLLQEVQPGLEDGEFLIWNGRRVVRA